MGWGEEEFKTIELGDERLNRRAVLLAEQLGQKPSASIRGACQSWAQTAAAYRFLSNEEVNWDKVLGCQNGCRLRFFAGYPMRSDISCTENLIHITPPNSKSRSRHCHPGGSVNLFLRERLPRARGWQAFTVQLPADALVPG